MALLPLGDWTRRGPIFPTFQPWEGSLICESSVLYDSDDSLWKLFYFGGQRDGWTAEHMGMGYATALSPMGPWTRLPDYNDVVGTDITSSEMAGAEYETDGGGGVATGWSMVESVAGTPTCTIVAGRTGNGQRIQYTAQAGDTGKTIDLRQFAGGTRAKGDVAAFALWAKAGAGHTSDKCTCTIQPLVYGTSTESCHIEETFTPTTSWEQYERRLKVFTDGGAGAGSRIVAPSITITSDTAVIDLYVDDFTMRQYAGPTNPVKVGDNPMHGSVYKFGDTFYCWYARAGFYRMTSPDGIIWDTPVKVASLDVGGVGEWDHTEVANPHVIERGGSYYFFYCGREGAGNYYNGLATAASPDGPWTKQGIVSGGGGPSILGPIDGIYYAWTHDLARDGVMYDEISRLHSEDLYTWTVDANPLLTRTGADEGEFTGRGQIADPTVVTDGTLYYLFYSADSDYDPMVAPQYLKMATSPLDIGLVDYTSVLAKLDAVLLKTNTIGGAGAIAWPYTLTVNGMPCADAAVWVTSDEAGNNVVASGRTDNFGALVPVPKLDAGTYYFFAKKSGVNFSSPDIEVVA